MNIDDLSAEMKTTILKQMIKRDIRSIIDHYIVSNCRGRFMESISLYLQDVLHGWERFIPKSQNQDMVNYIETCRKEYTKVVFRITPEYHNLLDMTTDNIPSIFDNSDRIYEECNRCSLTIEAKNCLSLSADEIIQNKDNLAKTFGINISGVSNDVFIGCMRTICAEIVERMEPNVIPNTWKLNSVNITSYIISSKMLENIYSLLQNPNNSIDIINVINSDLTNIVVFFKGDEDFFKQMNGMEGIKKKIHYIEVQCNKLKGLPHHVELIKKINSILYPSHEDVSITTEQQIQVNNTNSINLPFYPSFTSKAFVSKELLNKDVWNSFTSKYEAKNEDNTKDSKKKKQEKSLNRIIYQILNLSIACDGVAVFKNSIHGNSVFSVSAYIENAPVSHKHSFCDMWFLGIITCDKAKGLSWDVINTDGLQFERMSSKRAYISDCYDKQDQYYASIAKSGKQMCTHERIRIRPGDELITVVVPEGGLIETTCKDYTPADSNGRQLLQVVIEDIKHTSIDGLFFFYGETVYNVHPVISYFRYDNPAGDLITNNSGVQGTNLPCRNCFSSKSVYNEMTNTITSNILTDLSPYKSERTVFISALAGLDRDDPIRLLSVVNLLRSKPSSEIVSLIYPMKLDPSAMFFNDLVQIVERLQLCCKKDPHLLWTAPCVDYWPMKDLSEWSERNNRDALGYVDIMHDVFPMIMAAMLEDMMHKMENIGGYSTDYFGSVILKGKTDSSNKKGNSNIALASFLREMKFDNIILDTDITTTMPASVYLAATTLIDKNLKNLNALRRIALVFLPDLKKVGNNVKSFNSERQLTAHDKMIALFCLSIWLFYDYGDEFRLSTFVRLFYSLGRFYNFTGPLDEAYKIQQQIRVLLFYLENEMLLESVTLSFHQILHFFESYYYCGPLSLTSCIYPEWNYKRLELLSSSPNPVITLSNRVKDETICSIMCLKDNIISIAMKKEMKSERIKEMFHSIDYYQFGIRVVSAYCSSCSYRESSCCSLLTFVDIELCSSINSFLNNTVFSWSVQPQRIQPEGCIFACTNDEIQAFANKICTNWKTDIDELNLNPSSLSLYESCIVNNKVCYSINKELIELKYSDFLTNQNSFGVLVDVRRKVHIIAIMGYFCVKINKEDVPFIFGYDVPIRHYCEDDYNYCFYLQEQDFNYKASKIIIGLDRINIENKCFVTNYKGSITCLMFKLDCFQYNTTKHYMLG